MGAWARHRGATRIAVLAVLSFAALMAMGGAARAQSPNTPTDPEFAPCESGSVTGDLQNQCHGEQWNLYGPLSGDCNGQPRPDGGLPCWAPLARDPQHASGVDMTGAWGQGNLGRPDVLIAYIEGGVNYDSDNIKDGLDHIYLNKGELPYPERADGTDAGRYDLNNDGRVGIQDYAEDPRVNPDCPSATAPFSNHQEGVTWSCVAGGQHDYLNSVHVAGHATPYLSPEDLIVVFGHCRISNGAIQSCPSGGHFDNDGNGYPNDVSGWNFDRNTNDPQTEDTSYSHAPGLISDIGGAANNGYGGVGECRDCTVVPIKQGAECLGRPDHWGAAILYATDLGATTISSVVVGYAYSSFNQKAIDYAYDHGVSLALDSNDFDSMDHTDGMLFNHAIPGNSLIFDQHGDNLQPSATTYFRSRSSVTSYGTHNIFSGYGTSTSGATPFMASMLGMVQSAGLNARGAGVIPSPLTPDEVKQVMMDSASPVIPQTQSPNTAHQWPGNPLSNTDADHTNWSTQYGYGRPDIGAATQMVMQGRIPPTAEISSPDWFQYVDPQKNSQLPVYGKLAPSRVNSGGGPHWTLEYALGADPADATFHTVATGDGPASGKLGTIDLSQIPAAFYEHPPAGTLQPDGAEQYSLTIRLREVDGNGLKAEDRRTVGLRHDPDLVGGEPKRFGSEISGAPTYADLEGHHELDVIFSTYDGDVHALRPDGSEVPGYPVHSDQIRNIDPFAPENLDAPAYRDNAEFRDLRDPLSGIAVGDLKHDGSLDVVATGMNGFVYAWDGQGRPLNGFPAQMDTPPDQHSVPTPRSPTPHSRDPQRGAWAAPTLAPLEGGKQLDILIPGWDSQVYAWRPNGSRMPGWPVDITLPSADYARDGVDPSSYMRDPKLMYSVGVADVKGTGTPQVFVSSFDCSGRSASTQDTVLGLTPIGSNPPSKAWLYGVWPDGNDHPGGAYLPNWPVTLPALSFCYDQSIDFVGESVAPPLFGDFDGSGLKVVSSAVTGNEEAINPDGSVFQTMEQGCTSAACSPNPPYRPSGDSHTLTLTGQGGLGDLLGTGKPQLIQSSTGVESILLGLGDDGQSLLPQVYEKAWDVPSGSPLPGFPQRQDGFPFYDAPITADVGEPGPARDAIEANDNYFIHAWGPGGVEAPGFPKYTGQWTGFAGSVADPRLDGQLQLAYGTREGDLFLWRVNGDAKKNDSWWHGRHDERNTGQYGLDTRRPAVPDNMSATRSADGVLLNFTAPGDDWTVGTATSYDVRWSADPITADNFDSANEVTGVAPPGPAGTSEQLTLDLPSEARYVAVRAVDDAGNLGEIATTGVPAKDNQVPPGGGAGAGGGGAGEGQSGAEAGVTGQRAAALKRCHKKKRRAARRRCIKRASRLPL
jgi:hypothetical protein